MRSLLIAAAISFNVASLSAQVGQPGNPAASRAQAQAWTVETIQWQEVNADGTRYSVLEGRRDVPGQAFTYAFYVPAGYWEHHWHSSDARVVVVQGALRLSYGPVLDSTSAKAYPVGSYVLVPANSRHTMGADVPTVIIGTAIGPWHTDHNAEQHHH